MTAPWLPGDRRHEKDHPAAGSLADGDLAARKATAVRVPLAAGVRGQGRLRVDASRGAVATAGVPLAAGVRRHGRLRADATRGAAAAIRVPRAPVVQIRSAIPVAGEGRPEQLQKPRGCRLLPGRGSGGRGPGDCERCQEGQGCDPLPEREMKHEGSFRRGGSGEGLQWPAGRLSSSNGASSKAENPDFLCAERQSKARESFNEPNGGD
jgi:hypothetical protein